MKKGTVGGESGDEANALFGFSSGRLFGPFWGCLMVSPVVYQRGREGFGVYIFVWRGWRDLVWTDELMAER